MAFFQPLHIHRPALNRMVFDDLSRPFAELHRPLVVHLEAYGNNRLQIVMRQFPINLTSALGLNYPEFPDSCLLGQFAVRIDFFDMLVDRAHIHIIQCRHHLLRQPDVLILIAHFKAGIALTRRSHKGQVFCCGAANDKFFFLLIVHITVPSLQYQGYMSRKSAQSLWQRYRLPYCYRGTRHSKASSAQWP